MYEIEEEIPIQIEKLLIFGEGEEECKTRGMVVTYEKRYSEVLQNAMVQHIEQMEEERADGRSENVVTLKINRVFDRDILNGMIWEHKRRMNNKGLERDGPPWQIPPADIGSTWKRHTNGWTKHTSKIIQRH